MLGSQIPRKLWVHMHRVLIENFPGLERLLGYIKMRRERRPGPKDKFDFVYCQCVNWWK